jgi:hypothetical protein
MVQPTPLRPPPSPERRRLRDPNLLLPLEMLLLQINDPNLHPLERMDAIQAALPYCHHVKGPEPPVNFSVNGLRDAGEIMQMQRKIARAMCRGEVSPATAKAMIETLAVMVRTLDATEFEQQLAALEADEAVVRFEGPAPVRIIEVPSEDDEPPPLPAAE